MKTFIIPFKQIVYGHVVITTDRAEEAISQIRENGLRMKHEYDTVPKTIFLFDRIEEEQNGHALQPPTDRDDTN